MAAGRAQATQRRRSNIDGVGRSQGRLQHLARTVAAHNRPALVRVGTQDRDLGHLHLPARAKTRDARSREDPGRARSRGNKPRSEVLGWFVSAPNKLQ